MATGLRKLIRNAGRTTSSALLARRLRRQSPITRRLGVEELEERIAPAAGDFGGTGTAGATTMTLVDGETATLELGTDTYTLTAGGGFTTGDIVITFDAASGSATDIVSIDFGNSAALDAATTLTLTSSNGTVTDTLTIDSVIDGNDNSSTVDLAGNNDTISDAMVVGTVTLDASGIDIWNTNGVTSLTTETVGTSMRVGAVGAGGITASTSFAGTLNVTGSLAGPLTSAAGFGAITLATGSTVAGDITATTGGIAANITATTGNIAGDIVATAGDIDGDIDAVTGSITGTIQATAGDINGTIDSGTALTGDILAPVGSITGDITVDAGGISAAGSIVAGEAGDDTDADTDNDITGLITVTSGGIAGTISAERNITGGVTITAGGLADGATITAHNGSITTTAINIVDTGLSGDIAAPEGNISAAITVTAGGITATGSIIAGDEVADTDGDLDNDVDSAITVTAGGIAAGAKIIGERNVDGAIVVVVGGHAGTIQAVAGDIGAGGVDIQDGGVAATGLITAGDDILGAVQITDDAATGAGLLGTVSAANDITGATTITAGGIGATGQITAGSTGNAGSINGAVTVTAGGVAVGGIIRGETNIGGNIIIDAGGHAGTIQAVTGDIAGVDIQDGGIAATGTVSAGNDINGAVQITDDDATGVGLLGSVTANVDINGAVTVTAGGIGAGATLAASTGDINGNVLVSAGGIDAAATVTIGNDLNGNITATAGDIATAIAAANDINGNIVATAGVLSGLISAVASITGSTITAGGGAIAGVAAGTSIGGGTAISATDDVTSVSAGTTISATITADSDTNDDGDVVSVTAGGSIAGTITGENILLVRSGGLAVDPITATITADNDIDIIDAGAGTVSGTVTAGVGVSGSPLATFISDSVSYAVWAVNAGTQVATTAVTALITFVGDPSGAATLAIAQLANTGAAFDLLVTTRADTSAEQALTDPDLEFDDGTATEVTVTIGATAPVAITTLSVEGNYTTLGTDPQVTQTNVNIEGGVAGTANVAAGEDILFGSIVGNLAVNVAGGGTAGILTATDGVDASVIITVTGSLAGFNLGNAAEGKTGDFGSDAQLNLGAGSSGPINVNGDWNGSATGGTFEDITISGNLGDSMTSDIAITSSGMTIGDIIVGGSIGADAAQAVVIQSNNSAIGLISAGGNIGAGNGGTTISAQTNVGGVQSGGSIGDAGTSVSITATTGTIGAVSSAGNTGGVGINAGISAGNGVTAVTSQDPAGGSIGGSITSTNGNIGTVSTVEANISSTITANNGDITTVVVNDNPNDGNLTLASGVVSGVISAGGNIDTVQGLDVTGAVTANVATAASPVTTFTYVPGGGGGGTLIDFIIDGNSGPNYSYTFSGGATPILDLTIDNAAGAVTEVDLSLTTSENLTGALDPTQFSLNTLNFTAATVTAGNDNIGTLRVEGNTNVVQVGTLNVFIAEGNAALPISISDSAASDGVNGVAVGSIQGVDDPSAAQLAGLFTDPDAGESVVFEAPADQAVFSVPASFNSVGGDVSFAAGNATGFDSPILLAAGTGSGLGVNAYVVTYTAADGSLTVQAAKTSDGAVTITGDLDTLINALDLDTVVITGSVTENGAINATNIDSITVGTTGDLNSGNMDGSIVVQSINDPNGTLVGVTNDGNIGGAVTFLGSMGVNSLLQTSGNLAGALTLGQETVIDGILVGAGGNMLGSVIIGGNLTGGITSLTGNIGGSGLIMVGGGLTAVTANNGIISADIFTGGTSGGSDSVTLQAQGVTGDLALGAASGIDSLTINLREDSVDTNPQVFTFSNDAGDGAFVEIAAGNVNGGLTIDRITLLEDTNSLSVVSNNDNVSANVNEIIVLENATDDLDITIEGTLGTVLAAEGSTAAQTSEAHQSDFIAAYNAEEGTSLSFDVFNSVATPTAMDLALNDDGLIALDITPLTADAVTGGVIASGNINDLTYTGTSNQSFGNLVSLDGIINSVQITVIGTIGDIAAEGGSSGTDGLDNSTFIGTSIALGGTTLSADLTAAFGAAIGGGVPTWFPGGVLVENGDIDETDFTAAGAQDLTTVGSTSFITSSGDAMGVIYVPRGTVELGTDLFLKGSFGGYQVPMGTVDGSLDMDANGFGTPAFGIFIAESDSLSTTSTTPQPDLKLVGTDQIFVTESQPFMQNSVNGNDSTTFTMRSVEVTGSGTLVWLNDESFDDVLVIGGLAAGATVDILGGFSNLNVQGNWQGEISVHGNPLLEGEDDLLGSISSSIQIKGDIDVVTADLTAFELPSEIIHDGGFLNNGSPVISDPNAIDNSDMGDRFGRHLMDKNERVLGPWNNQFDKSQTLVLQGSAKMTAVVDLFFGEVQLVDIQGSGNASFVSAEGLSGSESDISKAARDMVKAAGKMDASEHFVTQRIQTDYSDGSGRNVGSAHVDELRVGWGVGSKTSLNGLVINGDVDYVNVMAKAQNVWVSGHVGEFDVTEQVNKATFLDSVDEFKTNRASNIKLLDSVDEFTADRATNILIDGDEELDGGDEVGYFSVIQANKVDIKVDVDLLSANKLNRVTVDGWVSQLTMFGGKQGSIVNSLFMGDYDGIDNLQDGFPDDDVPANLVGGVFDHNIDYRETILIDISQPGNGGGDSSVGFMEVKNPLYNPIKVRNSSGIYGLGNNFKA
jgi:hypothetical protein